MSGDTKVDDIVSDDTPDGKSSSGPLPALLDTTLAAEEEPNHQSPTPGSQETPSGSAKRLHSSDDGGEKLPDMLENRSKRARITTQFTALGSANPSAYKNAPLEPDVTPSRRTFPEVQKHFIRGVVGSTVSFIDRGPGNRPVAAGRGTGMRQQSASKVPETGLEREMGLHRMGTARPQGLSPPGQPPQLNPLRHTGQAQDHVLQQRNMSPYTSATYEVSVPNPYVIPGFPPAQQFLPPQVQQPSVQPHHDSQYGFGQDNHVNNSGMTGCTVSGLAFHGTGALNQNQNLSRDRPLNAHNEMSGPGSTIFNYIFTGDNNVVHGSSIASNAPARGIDGMEYDRICGSLVPGQGHTQGYPEDVPPEYKSSGQSNFGYPFPSYDVRLYWDPNLTHPADGHPNMSILPSLPNDWQLISWNQQYHPVVFDPWHQIFSLMPNGPKLLSDDELYYYNLHKHAPGGYLHPLTRKWMGNDWVNQEAEADTNQTNTILYSLSANLLRVLATPAYSVPPGAEPMLQGIMNQQSDQATQALKSSEKGTKQKRQPNPREPDECPDGLITVRDGWRWLAERSGIMDHGIVDIPSSVHREKPDRGTKLTIPWIMMMAEKGSLSTGIDETLENQDGKIFDGFVSVAPPERINLKVMGPVEMNVLEKLTYLSKYYVVWENLHFLRDIGVKNAEFANTVNYTRGLEGSDALISNTIAQSFSMGKREREADNLPKTSVDMNDLTLSSWTMPRRSNMYKESANDYPLLALRLGILPQHLPQGDYAGPLTKLMDWCIEHKKYNAMLSDVPRLLSEANISPRIQRPSDGTHPDAAIVKEVMPKARAYMNQIRHTIPVKKHKPKEGQEKKPRKKKAGAKTGAKSGGIGNDNVAVQPGQAETTVAPGRNMGAAYQLIAGPSNIADEIKDNDEATQHEFSLDGQLDGNLAPNGDVGDAYQHSPSGEQADGTLALNGNAGILHQGFTLGEEPNENNIPDGNAAAADETSAEHTDNIYAPEDIAPDASTVFNELPSRRPQYPTSANDMS